MARTRDRVVIGFVHPTDVSAYFLMSLTGTLLHDLSPLGGNRVVGVENEFSSANISGARNRIAAAFLDNYDAEWLLFIDADMQFGHDALEGILANAHDKRAPVVGGLCFGIDNGRLFPTLYDLVKEGGRTLVMRRTVVAEAELTRVTATGAAFLLIHRDVLTAIRDKGFNKTYPWFQETELDGTPCSEDFTFCLRSGLLGYPIHVDTAVKIGHHKSTVLTHDMFQAQRAQSGGDGDAPDAR